MNPRAVMLVLIRPDRAPGWACPGGTEALTDRLPSTVDQGSVSYLSSGRGAGRSREGGS